MKINLYILADYLKGCSLYPSKIHAPLYTCGIEDVSIYQNDIALQPNIVYLILDTQKISANHCVSGNFIVLTDQTPGNLQNTFFSQTDASAIDFITVPGTDMIKTLEEVQKIFRTFRNWEMRMYHMITNNASLKALGIATLPFLYNPLCMDTASLRNVFLCERNKPENLRVFAKGEEGNYETPETIEAFRLDPDFRKSVDELEPTIFPADIMGYRILYYNIRENGIYVCRLMALEVDRPIRQSDFAIIKILAVFIQLAMHRQHIYLDSHPRYLDTCISQLLHGFQPDAENFERAIHEFGWKEESRYLCLVFPVSEKDEELHTVSTMMIKLENSFSGTGVFRGENELIMISDLSEAKCSREEMISQVVYIIRENILKVGVSFSFAKITQLRDYYLQAQAALLIGARVNPMIWCYRYEQYELYDFLHLIHTRYHADTLCPEGLCKLIAYDKKHGTEFTKSLKVYLENDTHITRTIRHLYIQRATFMYHLKRIMEISDFKLDDPNLRLELRIIFMMLEQSDQKNNY